jgi:hypothetical protein
MAADVIFSDLLLTNCRIVRISGQFPRIPRGVETGIALRLVADCHMFVCLIKSYPIKLQYVSSNLSYVPYHLYYVLSYLSYVLESNHPILAMYHPILATSHPILAMYHAIIPS